MSNQPNEELNPSELGTLDYWENIYLDEINNFQEHGDEGEIWFGKNNAEKLIKSIVELNLSKDDKIIDLGCGNGWTLMQLCKKGFANLHGVDYSPKAIELARGLLKANYITDETVKLQVCDILNINGTDIKNIKFKLIHDKGTYDAISLNPDNSHEKRNTYIKNIVEILEETGFLIISSCNWTKDELQDHFKNDLKVVKSLETPTFSFGGQTGQSITNIIFEKKKKRN